MIRLIFFAIALVALEVIGIVACTIISKIAQCIEPPSIDAEPVKFTEEEIAALYALKRRVEQEEVQP